MKLVIGIVLAFTAVAVGQQPAPLPVEYKVVSFPNYREEDNTKLLNEYARQGWEFVGPFTAKSDLIVFKRTLPAARDDEAKKDADALQGTWYTVSVSNGEFASGEDKTDTITYSGTRYVQKRDGQVTAAGTFKIVDAKASPKQIDYVCTEGEFKGIQYRSIYTLNGDDHAICSDDGTDARPKQFSGKAGFHRVNKRVAK